MTNEPDTSEPPANAVRCGAWVGRAALEAAAEALEFQDIKITEMISGAERNRNGGVAAALRESASRYQKAHDEIAAALALPTDQAHPPA